MRPIEDLIVNHVREVSKDLDLTILLGEKATVPGFYRPRKNWDIIALDGERLVFAIEAKSQDTEKLGNNANNRNEEAIGSATDLRLAHTKKLVNQGDEKYSPWLGYLFILEDDEQKRSTRDAAKKLDSVFPLDPIYGERPSYARRYHVQCQRLLETGLYNGAGFIISDQAAGGTMVHPDEGAGIRFSDFMSSLDDYLAAYQR